MKKKLFTVLLTLCLSLPFVVHKAFAETPTSVVTSYGSYIVTTESITGDGISIGLGNLGINVPFTNASLVYFRYNFNGAKSGSLTIRVTSYGSYYLKQCVFGIEGATISTMPSLTALTSQKEFRVTFTNTDYIYFSLCIPYPTQFTDIATPISLVNVNIQDGVDLADIDSTLDLYMPGMSTSLSNIESDIDNLNSNISTLLTYTDGLEDLLQFNYLSQFDWPMWQYSALYWGNSIVRGTDYPDIVYFRGLPWFRNNALQTSNGTFTDQRAIRVPANSQVVLYLYTTAYLPNGYYSLVPQTSGNTDVSLDLVSNYYGPYQFVLNKFTFTNSSNGVRWVELEFTSSSVYFLPYYFGSPLNVPDEVNSFFGFEYDNTYTRLLEEIKDGIGNIGGSEYDTSAFNTAHNTIDNLNDNIQNSFDNNVNSVLLDMSNQSGFLDGIHFNAVSNVIDGFFNDVFVVFPQFKYFVVIGLICFVLGVLL